MIKKSKKAVKYWHKKGQKAFTAKRWSKVIACADLEAKASDDTRIIGWCWFNKAEVWKKLKRPEKALKAQNIILAMDTLHDPDDPGLTSLKIRTLVAKADLLNQMDRVLDCVAVHDQILQEFGDLPDHAGEQRIASALTYAALDYFDDKRWYDVLPLYDHLIARFSGREDLQMRETAAWAMLNKGAVLDQLGRHNEEGALYDRLIAEYGRDDHAETQVLVVKAINNKALIELNADRIDAGSSLLRSLIERFGDSNDPEIVKCVTNARKRLADLS